MTLVRQKALRTHKEEERPSDSMIDALAFKIANLDRRGIDRAIKNLKEHADRSAIPHDSPLATVGPQGLAATFYRGTLRRLLYSQPLPGALSQGARPGASVGLALSGALKRKLEGYLSKRPRAGSGYVVQREDLLFELIEEAYEGEEDDGGERRRERLFVAALLEMNRHLGLKDPELETAAGQLMFFPELDAVLELEARIAAGIPVVGFPGLERFLDLAGLEPEEARQFHWVRPALPASDANLATFGKRFAFSGAGYRAAGRFDRAASELPAEWVVENLQPEMHNARINADHQYNRRLLIAGRYNHVRC